MIPQDSPLVTSVQLVDRLLMSQQLSERRRWHEIVYTDRLFLKVLVTMIVRHLHKFNELLNVLAQLTVEMAEMAILSALLHEQDHFMGPNRADTAGCMK